MSARATKVLNRALLAAILGMAACLVLIIPTRQPSVDQAPVSAPAAPPAQVAPPAPLLPSSGSLLIPVAGVTRTELADGFNLPRGNGRRHEAIDIMAPRGTPILAAAEGSVEKLYFSQGGGGITIYVRSPDQQWMYYYAHLDRYAPGLAEGQQVRRGTPIGFVGSTGDASPDGPHLHFAVNAMAPGERWWQGRPVNPYPLLTGSGARR
jgi:murein DD-endopeptidase MepM/ murein hydrolase activator NlpD